MKTGEFQLNESQSLVAHLEELRWRIIRSFLVVMFASVAAFQWQEELLLFLTRPVGKLKYIAPAELFLTSLKISFFTGILLTLPYLFYELWCFVSPGLFKSEKKAFLFFLPAAIILFYTGVFFAIEVAIPAGLSILLYEVGGGVISPEITLGNYCSFLVGFSLVFGSVFELPLIMLFLHFSGILPVEKMRNYRRHAILLILIFAGIFSPPDVLSQLVVAVPMLILYEAGIVFIRVAGWLFYSNVA